MGVLLVEPLLAANWSLDPNVTLVLMFWFVGYAFLLFLWSIHYDRRQLWLQRNSVPRRWVFIPAFKDRSLGRRAWLRREGNPTPVLIAEMDGSDWQAGAAVVNRSQGGLRVVHTRPFEPGKILRILSRHAPNQIWWVQVEVKNCRRTPNGWELGCQFSDALPWSVLLLFG